MMMKKLLALLMAGTLVFSFAACGNDNQAGNDDDTQTENPGGNDNSTDDNNEVGEASYKLGMGIVVSMDSSAAGNAQVDATVATVVTDENGVIVKCELDCAQTKMSVADGIAGIDAVDTRTKMEKGSDYGMVAYGAAIAEWDAQAQAFADYVIGKTASEVTGLETEVNEEGHTVSTDPELLAGCTMSIADFQEAVAKACNDEYAKEFTADQFKLGLSVITEVDASSKDATAEEDGAANMYTDFAAVVVDADGVILADLLDVIQPKITFDAAGEITSTTFNGTKKELKENYGMVAYGNAIAEWNDQATTFENYVVGMTPADAAAIPTNLNDEGHYVVTDADPDLLAGCTMSVATFQEGLEKANTNAH